MIIKIKYGCNKKYIIKKMVINFHGNRMIIAKKEAQILKNYIDPLLNHKRN